MLVVAALLTFLFKRDTEVSNHEDELGKMHEGSDDLQPANKCTYGFQVLVVAALLTFLLLL